VIGGEGFKQFFLNNLGLLFVLQFYRFHLCHVTCLMKVMFLHLVQS